MIKWRVFGRIRGVKFQIFEIFYMFWSNDLIIRGTKDAIGMKIQKKIPPGCPKFLSYPN